MPAFAMQGIHKAAVYKDPAGKLHVCSAICTHMGAQVWCITHGLAR